MSRAVDERRFPSRGQAPKNSFNRNTFISFTPKQAEIDDIVGIAESPDNDYQLLMGFLFTGGALSVNSSDDGGGVKVLLYDRRLPFEERMFYSFYASTLKRCLAQIEYAIWKGFLVWNDGIEYKRQLQLDL